MGKQKDAKNAKEFRFKHPRDLNNLDASSLCVLRDLLFLNRSLILPCGELRLRSAKPNLLVLVKLFAQKVCDIPTGQRGGAVEDLRKWPAQFGHLIPNFPNRLELNGSTISSDAGLLAYRELDEAFTLTAMADEVLADVRTRNNIQHSLIALLRQSIYSRLTSYDDTNDAERLSVDPVMRQIVGGRAVDRRAVSTSQMARFETEVLTYPQNLSALIPGSRFPTCMSCWKTGAKVVRHARYVTFQMAQAAVSRKTFAAILPRMRRFAAISPRPAPI